MDATVTQATSDAPSGIAGLSAAPRTIAVMQPYFFPYAGYFRLFAQADEFVILDCVQFPRRGRVHRSQVANSGRPSDWLSLPLARQARETRICDLMFADRARREFDARLAALPWIRSSRGPAADRLREHLFGYLGPVVDYLHSGLQLVQQLLGLDTPVIRSSTLAIPDNLRGQERVIAIAKARAATTYLNAPGGRRLYAPQAFAAAGIGLVLLDDYGGRYRHLLPALMSDDPGDIAGELLAGDEAATLSRGLRG